MFLLILVVTYSLAQSGALTSNRCRCLANNRDCWPNTNTWQVFNVSVNGRLLVPQSSAAPCTRNYFNNALCVETTTHWSDSTWRSNQLGAMQYFHWENASCSIQNFESNCTQGSIPVIAVDAIWPEHIVETLKFVSKHNLRLVIKTTGHDLLGRSTAFGSILLWLHHMKNMSLLPVYTTCRNVNMTNVVRVSAGVQWGDVYTMLRDYGLTVLGGTSSSVAVAGGFIQSGGHSPLSRWGGMPTDQVLEYDVITADGRRLTVTPCQEGDLFWALSGGGPSSYAVVVSVVLKTFPSPVMVGSIQTIHAPNNTRFALLVRDFFRLIPSLADLGWSGYFSMKDLTMSITLIWPNGNLTAVNETMYQFYFNNIDLNFSTSVIAALPSFYDFYSNVLVGRDPTGYNGMVGSRLLPESVVRDRIDDVANVFMQMNGENARGSQLTISMVSGGKGADTTNVNNSINPAWRNTLLHVFYAQGWADSASRVEQDAVAAEVDRKTRLLDTLSNGTLFSCYMNEADPNEPRWRERFFGSMSLYNRLKAVKKRYDPDGILICKNCVGSDDWTSDLNCLKSSKATKFEFAVVIISIPLYSTLLK